MKESILHYVWQNKLFLPDQLKTSDGENVEVIDVGKPNTDAGPDFFNAKIRIGDTLWAGNVEIHIRSSEWNKHGHQTDRAYNNVILHVVSEIDAEVLKSDGKPVVQMQLPVPVDIDRNYNELINNAKWVSCEDKINQIPDVFVKNWLNYLLTERLEQKTALIQTYLSQTTQHWEEAFYIALARSFGFGTNSQAFEQLAKSLPEGILAKHKNDVFQLEALLFGQAGLLDESNDEYEQRLFREYRFLQSKYDLKPLNGSQWKLLRLRPDNFPHIRLAQFAVLVHQSSKLLSKIIDNPQLDFLMTAFACETTDYWKTHYRFGVVSPEKSRKTGKQSVESILINAVVPFLFCYGQLKGNELLKEKALSLLEQIPAERNIIITNWKNTGMKIESAYDSQAFLQLKKMYCDEKKCLRCRIGHKVLTI